MSSIVHSNLVLLSVSKSSIYLIVLLKLLATYILSSSYTCTRSKTRTGRLIMVHNLCP